MEVLLVINTISISIASTTGLYYSLVCGLVELYFCAIWSGFGMRRNEYRTTRDIVIRDSRRRQFIPSETRSSFLLLALGRAASFRVRGSSCAVVWCNGSSLRFSLLQRLLLRSGCAFACNCRGIILWLRSLEVGVGVQGRGNSWLVIGFQDALLGQRDRRSASCRCTFS